MIENLRKLQWCPHRRTTITFDPPGPPAQSETVVGNSLTVGLGPAQSEIGTCIGSACGQWRWDRAIDISLVRPLADQAVDWLRESDGTLGRIEPLPRPPGVDASYTWRPFMQAWTKTMTPAPGLRDGHCGLSGPVQFD